MNPLIIAPSSSSPPVAAHKPQSSDANRSGDVFGKMLTREIADQKTPEVTNTTITKDVSNTGKSVDDTVPKSAGDKQSSDSSDVNQANVNSSAEQLLMMAAQISQLSSESPTATLPQITTLTPTAPQADLSVTTGPFVNPMQSDATTQIDVTQTKMDTTPSVTAQDKPSSFDLAMSQAVGTNQAQNASIGSEKASATSDMQGQLQYAEKSADSIALAAANQSASELRSDKTPDSRPDLSAALAPLQQAIANHAQALTGHSTDRISPHVGTPAWNQSIGQKVVWMIGNEQQSASLTLNPPDLGPLQVVLSVSSTQANASFYSAQPEVRQALEAALPKLREMLGDAGIQLGQANVSAGSPQQQGSYSNLQSSSRAANLTSETAVTSSPIVMSHARIVREGMIDTFA